MITQRAAEGQAVKDAIVLIPLGAEFIALSPEELAGARDRARGILGTGWAGDRGAQATAQSPEPLLTAEQLAEITAVPAAWFLQKARLGWLPHVRLGRYPRFRLSEIAQHGAVSVTSSTVRPFRAVK